MRKKALVISCEHAVNTIPYPYHSLFKPFKRLLDSHEGIDYGALEVALYFQKVFSCDFIQAHTSRLLIDCNRSLTNRCFSEVTKKVAEKTKQDIISHYYVPYRQGVQEHVEKHLRTGEQVLHCSIHSFTPILNDTIRQAEIGFLYDPKRLLEKTLAKRWTLEIKKQTNQYRIRMNYPYKGVSDGLTTTLRQKYPPEDYLGIEIELNQVLTRNEDSLIELKKCLTKGLLQLELL